MSRRLPPLNAVRAFEAAARLESISGAADELAVTPTAISHQIRHLESSLDIKLFERAGRSIKLTEQAERMLPQLTQGLNLLAEAFEETYDTTDRNTISISTTREFARYWLQPRLGDFYHRHPHYTVNIFTSEQCAELEGAGLDLAVRYGPRQTDGQSVYLFQESYLPTISRALLSSIEGRATIESIKHKRLIEVYWEQSEMVAPNWKRWFLEYDLSGFEQYQRMSFDAYNLAVDALKRGFGAALLSRTIVTSEEFVGQFFVLPGPELSGYHYRVVNANNSRRKPAVEHFIDWLQNSVNQSCSTNLEDSME